MSAITPPPNEVNAGIAVLLANERTVAGSKKENALNNALERKRNML